MKAFVYYAYGSPDVLTLEEVEKPTPQDDEVLIKVHATSVNPLDWHMMRGEPFLARLEGGLRKPANKFLGADVAGVVEAVGKNVTRFKVGDAVFGDNFTHGLGAFAEYVCVPENILALKPANISFEQAAAVSVAALTALQGLRQGQITSRKKVLINGASGGVGSFAVQIAKSFGAEVTAVCSTRNLDLVRSIGADHVVDYTREDFTKNGQKYDLIYDAVGNRSVTDLKRALVPGGQAVIAGFTSLPRLFEHLILAPLRSMIGDKKVGMMGTVQPNSDDLKFMKTLLEDGKVVPLIDRCYPFNELPDAIRYLETSRARGKVVINVI